jgi:uncharacterized protein YbjT (DUF2867 family)/DNA-binding transcriptional MerR regulator
LYDLGMSGEGALRIGELSKRTGVSPELLRAWERRYGLLRPTRSAGGLRLYTDADLDRVRLMQRHLAAGLAAAEAAAAVSRAPVGEDGSLPVLSRASLREELTDALDRFDEPGAQAVLDRLLAVTTVETLLGEVVLPYLRELGERWARGDASVAQEHFASALLRGRMLGIARGWGMGIGPAAVLAGLPGEHHDLGLIAFGLALRAHGWRILYLGPDSPIDSVEDACRRLEASLVVLSAVTPQRVPPLIEPLRRLAGRRRLARRGAAAESGLDGVDVAYHLVHSLGSPDFSGLDRRAAENVAAEAERAAASQIVYHGGLGEDRTGLSAHLRSRIETAAILSSGAVPVTTLRAAVIVGRGSAAFETIVALVDRLPVMVAPRWLSTPTQPIALDDTIRYLEGVAGRPEALGQSFDIGGPEILTYGDMIKRVARIRGRRPRIVQVPVLTPRLSSYWLHLVTPVRAAVARPLIEGLRNPTVAHDDRVRRLLPFPLTRFSDAARSALDVGREQDLAASPRAPFRPRRAR